MTKKYILTPALSDSGFKLKIPYEKELNPGQFDVVMNAEGPTLVLAGAGLAESPPVSIGEGVGPQGARIDRFAERGSRFGVAVDAEGNLYIADRNNNRIRKINSMGMIRTIAGLAHNLGLSVVAEGIETPEQQAVLIEMGCDELQGYLLGRPVDEETFLSRLRAHGSGNPAQPAS